MSTKPRWLLEDAKRRARIAYRLATKHDKEVEPRLDAGLLDQLKADRAALGDATASRTTVLTGQKIATSHERSTATDGHTLVMGIREVVARTATASQTLRTAIGIGDGLKADNTAKVIAALDSLVTNAVALGFCGVLAEDIDEAKTIAADLRAADTGQADAKDARSDKTEDRIDTQLRVERAIDQISSRGTLAFRKSKVIAERFGRLVSSGGPTAADEADAGEEPAETPAVPAGA
jgi:hypothetical protein